LLFIHSSLNQLSKMGAFAGPGFGAGVNRPVKSGRFNSKIAGPGGRVVFRRLSPRAVTARLELRRATMLKSRPEVIIESPAMVDTNEWRWVSRPTSVKTEVRVEMVRIISKWRTLTHLIEVWRIAKIYRIKQAYEAWKR